MFRKFEVGNDKSHSETIRRENILFRRGYIWHTHYLAFRYPFTNATRCSGRHESLWHAAASVTRALHFSAHGRALSRRILKAYPVRIRRTGTEKAGGWKDWPMRNSSVVVVDVRPTTISRQFVTMPIKVDTLEENPPLLAREEWSPKMGSATSKRYLAIYDIDDHEPRDQDNASAVSMDVRPAKFTPAELSWYIEQTQFNPHLALKIY